MGVVWFTLPFVEYLLERPTGHIGWFRTMLCRLRGHPAGVWWFNPGGLEPDMHCRNCGDDLG